MCINISIIGFLLNLIVRDDPIITQQSIQAIASVSRKLDIPIVFVINVTPNTTEWVKIIKESSLLKHNQVSCCSKE